MNGLDFEQIYKTYFERVYHYALFLTQGDEHRSEEITQETFFKALRKIDSFRGESSINTWLCTIAKNIYFSEQRKKKPELIDEIPERSDESAGPEDTVIAHTQAESLYRRLHELPEPYKEVFTLRVFAELSFKEIAQLFGKNENWACVVFHRAKERLKKEDK
ncbi:MAG: sigma-70 family RNA polymerase sigma factor [Lachnospiraceae bacterium]|nr:sigma-70 family RNA polymerase sigma factor [Lachnospiraceae bacterium]